MGILDKQSKAMLVESMRNSLTNVLSESTKMTAKEASDHIKYVNESATYEQLLNITMNPLHESKYLPDYVLEGAVAILHRACMTGRKNIGPNAITEGALKLHKETGAVITESMLDAALESVVHGKGLEIVGGIIQEQMNILAQKEAKAKEAKTLAESKKTADKPAQKPLAEGAKKPETKSIQKPLAEGAKKPEAKSIQNPLTEAKKVKKTAKKGCKGKCK